MAKNVCIAVLAAGQARRFGASKLLQLHGNRPLLHHALDAATAAFPGSVYLVTGHDAEAMAEASSSFNFQQIPNPEFELGIGTSISAAARHCADRADALIIALADQPLVTARHLSTLADNWNGSSEQIVATKFSETLGPPVLFGRGYFDRLAVLTGDQGARDIIRSNAQAVIAVTFEPASIDIDTRADLDELDSL